MAKSKLLFAIFIVCVLHLVQVFVPETGFDAVWYHLPVAVAMIKAGGLTYSPEIYQTLNPLFSDIFFTFGFLLAGELGAKLVAYLFYLGLLAIVWRLARYFLSEKWSWLLLLIVSGFQVVAWQAASFYVDLAKAFWEITALLLIITAHKKAKKSLLFVGAFMFSAALATKAFSWLVMPGWSLILWFASSNQISPKFNFKKRFLFWSVLVFASITFYLPFAWHAFRFTSNAFFPISVHLAKLQEISGQSNLFHYLFKKIITLPLSVFYLLKARDYVFPFIFFFIPWLSRVNWQKLLKNHYLFWLMILTINQWLVWWFVPPLSTRYALSGFIILMLLCLVGISSLQSSKNRKIAFNLLLVFALLAIIPRLFVLKRSLKYLLHQQTTNQYYQQFRDGNLDPHLDNWLKIKQQISS